MDQWEINGIRGKGELPALAGQFSGPLVIMGSAPCLWDDLSKVQGKPDYMAVNWSGLFARKNVKHWVSKHPEFLPEFISIYRKQYMPTNTENENLNFFCTIFKSEIYSHGPRDAENNWQFDYPPEGSSGLFATRVGLALGYDPIWLAGIPLDDSGCFYDPPEYKPLNYEYYRQFWIPAVEDFKGRVKSFSGFTRELLGAP